MAQYVLIVAIVNLCLGYGLAIYLHDLRRPRVSGGPLVPAPPQGDPTVASPIQQANFVQQENLGPSALAVQTPREQTAASAAQIPQEWLDALRDVSQGNAFVEAATQVLKLEVGQYREQLVDLDRQMREVLAAPSAEAIRKCLVQIKLDNAAWLSRQSNATAYLQERQGRFEQFAELGAQLEHVLLEQAAQIETTTSNLDCLDFTTDPVEGGRRIIAELGRLLDLCHSLRDCMQESLVAILQQEGALAGMNGQAHIDSMTGLGNRSALHLTLESWLRDNAAGKRAASLAVIDFDALRRWNDDHGPQMGDRLIEMLSKTVTFVLRKDSGFDRAFRHVGGTVAAFFGDVDAREATSAVERIRQTIAASTIEIDGQPAEARVSSAVVEVALGNTSESLLKRAMAALNHAKHQGGNRTCLQVGDAIEQVAPLELDIQRCVVRFNSSDGHRTETQSMQQEHSNAT